MGDGTDKSKSERLSFGSQQTPSLPLDYHPLSLNMTPHTLLLVTVLAFVSIPHSHADIPPVIIGADNIVAQPFINDVILAYQLYAPTVTVTTGTGSFSANEQLLFNEQVDFAIGSDGLTALQQQQYPNVQIYPFLAAALVPVYRLDAVTTVTSTPISFTREALAKIYLGEITFWNDSAITLANPSLTFPNQTITVVYYNQLNAINEVFTTALGKYYSSFNLVVPVSSLPTWPLSNYSAYASGSGLNGVAATVETIDGAIGYSILAAARSIEAAVGAMVNQAGSTVTATSNSINFAVVELGTKSLQYGGRTMDLTDASGASAWPLCVPAYLMMDLTRTRNTCSVRQATVNFWLFIYQQTIATALAEARDYAVMPEVVLTELQVVNDLVTGILCNGSPAFSGTVSQQIIIGGASSTSFITNMFLNLYGGSSTELEYVFLEESGENAVDQFEDNEIDLAMFIDYGLTAATQAMIHPTFSAPLSPYQSAAADQPFITIPLLLTSINLVYNPQITASTNIGSYSIIIDLDILVRIIYTNVSSWQDPAILKYNPTLQQALGNQSAPMAYVLGCGSVPIAFQMFTWIYSNFHLLSASTVELISEVPAPSSTSSANPTLPCSAFPPTIFATQTEAAIDSIVMIKAGGVGYAQLPTVAAQFSLVLPSDISSDGTLTGTPTTAAVSNQLACVTDTFNPNTLNANIAGSQNSQCWPFTSIVYLSFRSSYMSSATNAASCARGKLSLEFVQWLANNTLLAPATYSQLTPRLSDIAFIRAAIDNAIFSVHCDENLLLMTLPKDWSLSSGVEGFGVAMAVLGMVALAAIMLCVVIYRTHPVIKAASPGFLLTSLVGVMMLLAGVILLVSPVNAANCSTLSWFLNIGFTLTFSPLFAKTWRIYQIFGRKKLSVVKINNRKLAVIVSSMIVIDAIVVAAWQGVSPVQPTISTTTSGNPAVENDYNQCSTSGAGTQFFIAVVVIKSVLLIYGAILAFSTRRVSQQFNESQPIAWAIYNVVFSIGIVAPIVFVISAVGDVLILLLVFVVLWISYFTASILVIPKLIVVFFGEEQNGVDSNFGNSSSINGFTFVSVTSLYDLPALRKYLSALMQQVDLVNQRMTAFTAQPTLHKSGPSRNSRKEGSTAVLSSPVTATKTLRDPDAIDGKLSDDKAQAISGPRTHSSDSNVTTGENVFNNDTPTQQDAAHLLPGSAQRAISD